MEELVTGAGGDEGVGEVILGETSPCSLKELSIRAGISGGQDAGEGHLWVNGNGKKMMLEEQSQPGHLCLSLQCMIPEGLEDHVVVMNGFSESFCLDEEEEEEGPGMERQDLTGTTAASSTTVVQDLNLVEIQDEAFDEVNPGGDCIVTRSSLSLPQKNCISDMVTGGLSNLTLSNGVLNSTEDLTCLNTSAVFSSPALLGHKPSLNHIECFDFKKANGGVHITSTNPRATCDCPDSDNSFRDNTNIHVNLEAGQTNGKRSDVSMEICQDNSPVSPLFQDNSPTPGSSAKCSAPNFLSPTGLNSDSPISGAESDEEEEEELSELSLPVRPHSLRTNPGVPLSLSCDATPLTPDEDGDFYFINEDCRNAVEIAGRRQSAPDKLPDLSNQNDSSEPKLLPKRFGIADFFTRSLFSRKAKEPKAVSHNASGWRLFGKTAARDADQTTDFSSAPIAQQEDQADDSGASPCSLSAGRRKKLEFEPLSTTALILEDRPANLPAKSEEETQRHKLEYEEMVAGAKKREMKDAQKKKRQMKERHRQEDSISNAMVIWNNEILPNWDTMKGTRRVRDLWWQGLPPSVRGRVWSLAIGNELNITPELYEIFLCRAKEKWRSYSETSSVNNDSESDGGASLADRESSLDLIKLDISRTFPSLFIFQRGGPYHDLLHSVLGAYTCYRPDIGYVQGMSFIAAVLILNLEEADAFITFANLLNKPCQMAFFRVDHDLMLKYFAAFEVFFEENLPRLFGHFQTNNLTPDLYLIDWIFTLFSKSLPLDVACRVWDVFCRDGEESLFRTGLGILRLYEDVLLQMDFIHIAQFLTRLPDDLQSHTLFNAMANTHMISRNRRWAQVFSALTKDGNKETERNNSPALRS